MSVPDVPATKFKTVVVGVDGRQGGRDALALATVLLEPGGRLILAAVARPRSTARLGPLFADADRRAAAETLQAARESLLVPAETVVVVRSSIAEGLHSVVQDHRADLLVLGSTRRGPLGRVMLGDDARRTLDGARCAVAIAPHDAQIEPPWRTIAIGDDGSAESELALAAARRLAVRTGARLRLCAVVGPAALSYGELSRMDISTALAERAFAEHKRLEAHPDADAEVLEGDPGEALAEAGEKADLLVIGSRSQGAWGRLTTGSTGDYLARHAPCPVLILPRVLLSSTAAAPDEPSPGPHGRATAAVGPTRRSD